ncbi:MAG: trypsin-like peptidase domain-containing protein [Saprospiraceae bacterium]|nr:trypsin-like peptidase domain-containing protein [Saprospiraceae bacterium]
MQNAQDVYIDAIKALIREDEIGMAIEKLDELDKKVKAGLDDDIIQQNARFRSLQRDTRDGVSTTQDIDQRRAVLRRNLLSILDDVPRKLELNAKIHGLNAYQFRVPDEANLEKIIGPGSNLLRINWLEKALKASKAVCRVVCADGNLGTGFLDSEGYLYTNNHVLSSSDVAAQARIEFNYEMDAGGNVKSRSSYALDATDFKTSLPNEFDFARVRVIDNPADPIKQWGYVEIDPTAVPTFGEAVTIIQHPKGEDKQIALHANEVIGQLNQHLFYTTDTQPGSSGSPVFNKDWKVVAIHHAGKTDAEGGLVVNARGDRKGANRGILFGSIFQFLGKKGGAPVASGSPVSDSGRERFYSDPVLQPTHPTPVPVPPQPAPANDQRPPAAVPLFLVVYALDDNASAKMLNKHLNVLKITKKITVYNVHEALGGGDVLGEAQAKLDQADYILALVSVNLFNEPAWFDLVYNAMENGKRVIPILIEKTDWEGTGLEKRKSLPSLNRTVSDFPSADAAWADVVAELKKLL